MGNHAEDGGVDAEVGRADAEHHEPHVRHRRERDQALHVGLGKTAEGAVMMPMTASRPITGPCLGGFGKHRYRDADEAVRAGLSSTAARITDPCVGACV